MAPSLEAMYDRPHFLLVSWPPSLRLTQLLAFKGYRSSILHYDTPNCKVGGVGMDFKLLVKVGQLQHRRLHQNALQCSKGFVACFIPFISDGGLLQEVRQRSRYLCKVLDCRNPTLAKCGGEAQHLEKLEVGSLPGLPNVQSSTARGKTPRIGVFLVSLQRS